MGFLEDVASNLLGGGPPKEPKPAYLKLRISREMSVMGGAGVGVFIYVTRFDTAQEAVEALTGLRKDLAEAKNPDALIMVGATLFFRANFFLSASVVDEPGRE